MCTCGAIVSGMQVAGRRFDDRGVLSLSEWFEYALHVPTASRTVGV